MCNCNDNINSVTVYTGPAGPTGPQGPADNDSILTGTSTTNLAATTGTKTITTQANISWVPGMRLRVSDGAPSSPRIMEGEVSTYTGTTLVLNVDYTEGPASLWNNWVIGVAGAIGSTGPTGATGSPGATGADSFDLLQNAILFELFNEFNTIILYISIPFSSSLSNCKSSSIRIPQILHFIEKNSGFE